MSGRPHEDALNESLRPEVPEEAVDWLLEEEGDLPQAVAARVARLREVEAGLADVQRKITRIRDDLALRIGDTIAQARREEVGET